MYKKHRVVTLIYDNLCLFEFGIASEMFGLPRPELDIDWYDFRVCQTSDTTPSGLGGITLHTSGTLRLLDSADTIVIPGWSPTHASSQLLTKLNKAHQRGARLVAICSGAFLLAQAGLLESRRATTHWRYLDRLQQEYAGVQVVPDVLYVEDGGIFTSAGSAAGIDLCLHIIRTDYGAAVANNVARRLVLPAHRSGGQTQFVAKPLANEATSLSPLLDQILQTLEQPHTVNTMARQAACSQRSLLRRFQATTGLPPMRWLTEQRIHRVKELLETTQASMQEIAEKSGFNTPETLRHHFRAQVGVSPSTYRRAFALRN